MLSTVLTVLPSMTTHFRSGWAAARSKNAFLEVERHCRTRSPHQTGKAAAQAFQGGIGMVVQVVESFHARHADQDCIGYHSRHLAERLVMDVNISASRTT